MKPVLHIIGVGNDHFEKLPLEIYRLLTKVKVIYVLAADQLAVSEMIEEGFPCQKLHLSSENANGLEIGQAILTLLDQADGNMQIEQAVLALPGQPLGEGKLVTSLQAALSEFFSIDTDFLAADNSLLKLTAIMAELRSPSGCVWDKEQTHKTLKKYLIEETYEVIDAIDTNNMNNFCEELGDLLLQVVFHSRIAEESGLFDLRDVIRGICDKLIHRHPHVFGSVIAKSSEEVLLNWDIIKKQEKAVQPVTGTSDFFNIPKGLPALLTAEETQKKAAKIGFDWDSYQGPLAKVYEELTELEIEIGNNGNLEDELGDLLFSIVNLSRFLKLNAEEALRQGTKKFQRRFNQMLALIDREKINTEKLSLNEMNFYWDLAKKEKRMG